ncbi:unnamed protein product [Sphagnum jensenii]|uniref:Homeobox domain-containing protein n=1 Tax=Sphagnum jensenii TaxID=128206 RepID=A0ABP1AI86_9BRYO
MAGLQQPSVVLDQINVTPTHRQVRVQQQQQRWTPSQSQLQILKNLYEQGNGTPNKQRLREITTELIQHGHVQETNVYNWFRNRKAYVKRRQQMVRKRDASAVDTNAESLQAAKQLRSAPGPTQSNCGGIGDSDAGGSSHSRAQRELDQWKGNNIYQPGAPTDMLLQLKNSNSTQPDLLAFARGTSSFEPHKLKQGE